MSSSHYDYKASRRGLVFVLLAGILWGTVGVSSKLLFGMSSATPLAVGFFRLALSVPVLLTACWFAIGRKTLEVSKHDLLLMLLMGFTTAVYQLLYLAAVERTGAAMATLITLCVAPIIVALFSVFITKEKPTATVIVALAGALVGTAIIVGLQENAGDMSRSMSGKFLALGSALGYAVIAVTTRKLASRYHPIQPITISFTFGALILLAAVLCKGITVDYPPMGWAILLYIGVIPTAVAYSLFIAGMRYATATVASTATLIEPLTSTILAWLIFEERFSGSGGAGVVVLVGSLMLLFKGGKPKRILKHSQ